MNSFIKRIERDDLKEQKQVRTHTPEDVQKIISKWMTDRSYATGHGDSVVDLLQELEWQVAERERERIIKANAPEIEKVNAHIKALAEPANSTTDFVEPVAWIEKDKDYLAVSADPFENAIPVYTAPPKREWVGLTDEERHDIREWQEIQKELGPVWAPMMLYLYVAIEAKLKEKNT